VNYSHALAFLIARGKTKLLLSFRCRAGRKLKHKWTKSYRSKWLLNNTARHDEPDATLQELYIIMWLCSVTTVSLKEWGYWPLLTYYLALFHSRKISCVAVHNLHVCTEDGYFLNMFAVWMLEVPWKLCGGQNVFLIINLLTGLGERPAQYAIVYYQLQTALAQINSMLLIPLLLQASSTK